MERTQDRRINPIVQGRLLMFMLMGDSVGVEEMLDILQAPILHAPKINLLSRRAKEQKHKIHQWARVEGLRKTKAGKPVLVHEKRDFTRSLMHIKPLTYNLGTLLAQATRHIQ